MAAFWLISLLLGITVVELLSAGPLEIAASSALGSTEAQEENIVIPDDDGMTDQICGTHPLKTIVKKIENSRRYLYNNHQIKDIKIPFVG